MIVAALLLSCLGIVTLYSSSPTQAIQQTIFCVVGSLLYLGLRSLNYKSLGPLVKISYLVCLALLVIVFILGFETRGSIRWIPLGLFNLQPSELAKPVMILTLAYFWSRHLPTWLNILKSLVILAPYFILIFRQPDLGTALTVGFIWLSILIAAHLSWQKLTSIVLLGTILTPVTWFFMQAYQRQRILSFLFPQKDPLGIGFHVIQSMIAVGSGQLMGRGLGRGTQSRLQFLPEFRTDFIFAFIAEELGFMGSMIVLVIYAILIFILVRLIFQARDLLAELMVTGVLGMLFFQIVVNIGMNTGIMPVTGITLPFLSYGGSSMLSTFMAIGLAASVARFGLNKAKENTFDLLG